MSLIRHGNPDDYYLVPRSMIDGTVDRINIQIDAKDRCETSAKWDYMAELVNIAKFAYPDRKQDFEILSSALSVMAFTIQEQPDTEVIAIEKSLMGMIFSKVKTLIDSKNYYEEYQNGPVEVFGKITYLRPDEKKRKHYEDSRRNFTDAANAVFVYDRASIMRRFTDTIVGYFGSHDEIQRDYARSELERGAAARQKLLPPPSTPVLQLT